MTLSGNIKNLMVLQDTEKQVGNDIAYEAVSNFSFAVYCQPSAYCVTPQQEHNESFTERKKRQHTPLCWADGSQNLPLADVITFYGIPWLHISHTQGDLIC